MRFFVTTGTIQKASTFTTDIVAETLTPIQWLIPTDNLFSTQWHLNNIGNRRRPPGIDINVKEVWDDYTGAGVVVGVVDDGVDYTHFELDGNYDTSLDRDEQQHDNDAAPSNSDDNHGTAVAGVIAAEQNSRDVVGVAFDATIVGLRIGFGNSDGPEQPAAHYNYAAANGIDILNNSWGYGGFFSNSDDFNDSEFTAIAAGLENAVENGRDGLGTIIFFASGNEGDQGQDANYHNLLNSRYTIAVGAIDRSGNITSFSTPGAPVLVTLPGDNILTTDRQGSAGYSSLDVTSVSGTSFSSPIGAGIAALILEANPELGWRDVQEIFALSAVKTDAGHDSWAINGAENWNGGGMHTSRWYGFGVTDTLAAVRLAETWTLQSTSANETSVTGSSSPGTTIPDLGTITDQITIGSGVNIDHVLINLNVSHTAPVDLIVTLISPDGTESQLVVQPGLVPGSDTTPNDGTAGDEGTPANNIVFTLSSTEFWGETGEGTWTLRIQDTLSQDSGQLNSWSIELWGDALSDDTTYFYTDEFSQLATGDASRRTIDDSDGINTINASAVTFDSVIDLSGATTNSIIGVAVLYAAGTIIHNAFAGDGDDVLTGNAFDNTLLGGRGDDTISGGDGTDTAWYLSNSTDFTFTMASPTEIQVAYTGGAAGIDEGTDIVTGIEFFAFADTTLTRGQVLVLAGAQAVPVFTSGTTADFAENGVGVAYNADATDEDSAAPTYAITGGADAALFNIDTVTGEVTFKVAPDFEAPGDAGTDNTYNIDITASSAGDGTVQSVAITVTNVNDNAPAFDSGATANFGEGGTGTAYDADATDPDGDSVTYSVSGGSDASLFNIDSATGEVTFKVSPDFEVPADAGGNNVYDIEVTASDGTNDNTLNVAITVTDVSGPPTFTSGESASFAENGTGTVYDAAATSPDGPTPTFAITGGVDAALFDIDGTTGEVTFKSAPDYEAPSDSGADNVYDIEITASSGGLDTAQNVAITVTGENDITPVFTSSSAANFAENGFGTAYDANATDVDGDAVTYSISGGADASLFNINPSSGVVTFKNSPDFENPSDVGGDNVYDIQVTASDGIHDTTLNVAITVTDVGVEFNIIDGTNGDDELAGTALADQINGLDGNDRIDGGAGIDQLNGGNGDDVFLVGVGDGPDTYNGGDGTDTIAATEANVAIGFAGGVFGSANSIEVITNNVPSNGGFTVLTGTAGDDTLSAAGESDAYYIDGLGGRDTLIGGDGDDVLLGGADYDTLTGNGGADEFVFADGTGIDRITDFDPNSGDVINLSGAAGLTNFSQVQANMAALGASNTRIILPGGGAILLLGTPIGTLSADDFVFTSPPSPSAISISRQVAVTGTTIVGTSGSDNYDFSATTLEGITSIDMGAGNDTVVGSTGGDVINGDADDDTITGQTGNDTIDGGSGSDTAVFSGNRAAYTPVQIDGDSLTISGPDGTDTVHGVEFFQFDDQTLSFADLLGIRNVPVFSSGSTANFAENGTGTVYDADATDLDSPAPTYAISGGVDAALFAINSVTGEVTFNAAPDYETPADAGANNVYNIEITASSGGDDTTQAVAITVTNLNDNLPIITSAATANFAENGTGVAYDANATDADGSTPTYSISGGADASLFNINTSTGEVTFKSAPDFETPLDSGGDNTYEIEVTASDGTNTDDLLVAITVTDVDESTPAYVTLTGTEGNNTLDASTETDNYYIEGLGGDDTILGGAGDDIIVGGNGRDSLRGDGGADTFVYSDGSGVDLIADFDPSSGDVINLAGVADMNDYADLQAALTAFGSRNSRITFADGGFIILMGVKVSDLSADDFSFTPPPSPSGILPTRALAGAEDGSMAHSILDDSFIVTGESHGIYTGFGSADQSTTGTQAGFVHGDWVGLESDGFIWSGNVAMTADHSFKGLSDDTTSQDRYMDFDLIGDGSNAFADPVLVKPIEAIPTDMDPDFLDYYLADAFSELHTGHLDDFIL